MSQLLAYWPNPRRTITYADASPQPPWLALLSR